MTNEANIRTEINWQRFEKTKSRLGSRFFDHLNYFMDDCPRSLFAIEHGIQSADALSMILPADRLAEDAELFGADDVADIANHILRRAQHCITHQKRPDELLDSVIELRPVIADSLRQLRARISPLEDCKSKIRNRGVFGNKVHMIAV